MAVKHPPGPFVEDGEDDQVCWYDFHTGYGRARIVREVQDEFLDQLTIPEHIQFKLALARKAAVERYQQLHGEPT